MTRPDVEVMRDLLARVIAATGPDRGLDYDLARMEGWSQHSDEADPVYSSGPTLWWAEPGEDWSTTSVPPYYTSSMDSAVALVQRSGFAACIIEPSLLDGIPSEAAIRTWEDDGSGGISRGPTHKGEGASTGLAIITALLTALIAAEGRDHG